MSVAEAVATRSCAERGALRCGTCSNLFDALTDQERTALDRMRRHTLFAAKELLFAQGDPASRVFSLSRGVVRVSRLLPDGRRQVVGFALPGDFLGQTLQDTHMLTAEAIEQAAEVGLDLVEVSPNADPPVCKFLDVGKFKYEAQKKANLARKSQKTQEIKEIKMRPNIDDHDFDVKMKKVFDFLGEGDKVKMTMRFRGREMSHTQLGLNVLQRVAELTSEIAKVEAHPRTEGRQMLMVIAPK